MRTVYNLLFLCLFIISSPYYFLRLWRRGGWRKGFWQRLGYYDEDIKSLSSKGDVIWLHAVSVGEMNLCAELVRALKLQHPEFQFLVSTTTTTGMGELRKKLPDDTAKIYYPIDFPNCVCRAFDTVLPKAIIFVEAEVWPNFVWHAVDHQIPLFLANARISDRSFPRYLKFRFLFKNLFGSFKAVGAQSEEYAVRLREVGCQPENIEITGNIKFDTAKVRNGSFLDTTAIFSQIGVSKDAQILLGGSTHQGEEEILAEKFQKLRKKFPRLFLVLVPRHFERASNVGRILERHSIKFIFRSKITPDTKLNAGTIDCLVVDSTGELMCFYEQATIVFVGKSISAKGGQNPIEPAALGKATVFGPNMQNFSDVARIFIKGKGVIQVQNVDELENAFAQLLGDSNQRALLGAKAQQIVRDNQGALIRTVNMISLRLQHH